MANRPPSGGGLVFGLEVVDGADDAFDGGGGADSLDNSFHRFVGLGGFVDGRFAYRSSVNLAHSVAELIHGNGFTGFRARHQTAGPVGRGEIVSLWSESWLF